MAMGKLLNPLSLAFLTWKTRMVMSLSLLGLLGGFHDLSEVWAQMSRLSEAVPGRPIEKISAPHPPSPLPHAPPRSSVLFMALTGLENTVFLLSCTWSGCHHKNIMSLNQGVFVSVAHCLLLELPVVAGI